MKDYGMDKHLFINEVLLTEKSQSPYWEEDRLRNLELSLIQE